MPEFFADYFVKFGSGNHEFISRDVLSAEHMKAAEDLVLRKLGGKFVGLDRPMQLGSASGGEAAWSDARMIVPTESVYCNLQLAFDEDPETHERTLR